MIKDTTRTGLVIDSADRITSKDRRRLRYRVYFTDGTTADTMSAGPITDGEWLPLAGTDEPVTVTFTQAGKIRAIEHEWKFACPCGFRTATRAGMMRHTDEKARCPVYVWTPPEPEAPAEPEPDPAAWPPGKTFGELTGEQRTAAVKKAASQLQAELTAAAPEIGRLLDGTLVPGEAGFVSRTGETFASHQAHRMYDPPADQVREYHTAFERCACIHRASLS